MVVTLSTITYASYCSVSSQILYFLVHTASMSLSPKQYPGRLTYGVPILHIKTQKICSESFLLCKWRRSHPGWVYGPWPPAPVCHTEEPLPWSKCSRPTLRSPTATSRGRQSSAVTIFMVPIVRVKLHGFVSRMMYVMMHFMFKTIPAKITFRRI